MTAPDLKPCPFCGNADVYLRMVMQEADVFCQECETNGPVHETEAEAIAAWNTRATPAAMTPEVAEAINRLQAYLARRERDNGASQDVLHCYDYHPDWGGIELRASDIRAALDALREGGDNG